MQNPTDKVLETMRGYGRPKEAIHETAKILKDESTTRDLKQRHEDIKTGRVASIPWPWAITSKLAPGFRPGFVTILAGSPGSGKSFVALQCLHHWIASGTHACMLELEGCREDHMQRLLAQLGSNSNLADWDWIAQNAEEADRVAEEHKDTLDLVGAKLRCESMSKDITYDDVSKWMRERAEDGARILIIDPVTSLDGGGQPWKDDKRFTNDCIRIAGEYGCSILLVMHPKKDYSEPSMGEIGGGAAFTRHVDCVIWLHRMDLQEKLIGRKGISSDDFPPSMVKEEVEINRVLHILKGRHGGGVGKRLGFLFDEKTFRLEELGILLKED